MIIIVLFWFHHQAKVVQKESTAQAVPAAAVNGADPAEAERLSKEVTAQVRQKAYIPG